MRTYQYLILKMFPPRTKGCRKQLIHEGAEANCYTSTLSAARAPHQIYTFIDYMSNFALEMHILWQNLLQISPPLALSSEYIEQVNFRIPKLNSMI